MVLDGRDWAYFGGAHELVCTIDYLIKEGVIDSVQFERFAPDKAVFDKDF